MNLHFIKLLSFSLIKQVYNYSDRERLKSHPCICNIIESTALEYVYLEQNIYFILLVPV
jgi:hypothetical protein